MSRIYKFPPITEAVCEFRFEPSQTWDSTFFGLIYDRLKDSLPKKRQEIGIKFEVGQLPEGARPQVVTAPPRMKFLSEDEKSLVQISNDMISINKLKPYDNWESFKGAILQSFTAFVEVNHPKGIRRIGTRYINRIEIPANQVDLADYLLAVPGVPKEIPQVYDKWVQRVEVPFPRNGRLVLQSGSIREKGIEGVAFLLDIDFIIEGPELIALGSAEEMIEIAHRSVEDAFEACITDKTRNLFEQEKQ